MPETPPRIPRARMSPQERHLRSQLVQILSGVGLLRATLNPRQKVCGKPTCRCARGEKHSALYVVASEDGKPHQLFVPQSLEPQAKRPKWRLRKRSVSRTGTKTKRHAAQNAAATESLRPGVRV